MKDCVNQLAVKQKPMSFSSLITENVDHVFSRKIKGDACQVKSVNIISKTFDKKRNTVCTDIFNECPWEVTLLIAR